MADDFYQADADRRHNQRIAEIRAIGDRIFNDIVNYYTLYPDTSEKEYAQRKGMQDQLYIVRDMVVKTIHDLDY